MAKKQTQTQGNQMSNPGSKIPDNKNNQEKQRKKGEQLFRCKKIIYNKDNAGYVVNSTKEIKMPNGKFETIDKDPMVLHEKDDMIKKTEKTPTAPISKEDINILNAQSLNTGIYYQPINK